MIHTIQASVQLAYSLALEGNYPELGNKLADALFEIEHQIVSENEAFLLEKYMLDNALFYQPQRRTA